MKNDFVVNICNTILVLGIGLSYTYTFTLTMDAHAFKFNAPPSQFTNPHCGEVFTNLFTYDQHRNHATKAGTLCASLTMRAELTGVRRVDRPVPVLHARPQPGLDGAQSACGCGFYSQAASAQSDEHVAFYNLGEFDEFIDHALNSAKER